jgi:hypothetical protein
MIRNGDNKMMEWRIAGAVAALVVSLCSPMTGFAQAETTAAANGSLAGTYVYRNTTQNVASFGVIHFDGAGNLNLKLLINAPSTGGERTTVSATGVGSYRVEPNGMGEATVEFKGIPIEQGVYDFVIVSVDDGIAKEVYAVLRSGGIKGQLVNPTWIWISGLNSE